ncbi:hypothetical protein CTRI78_v011832 [Colletotrichum trifolii]|uniref:Uncharacterized protein n=1 Tax=Colletotrichum trifolii TaxID=5466 RepID=A0A4R8QBV2_COLTR|nr:hypothetical protein CTRI78_v011832 [Colletotrichum trifolii]
MVKEDLGVKDGTAYSAWTRDNFLSTSMHWQKTKNILQVVEEDLSEILLVISKWDTRERDRGRERPRWTRNDERKYRAIIGKLEGTTSRRVRDLQKLHSNIRLLKERLSDTRQEIGDDMSLRGAENIRFFTYVTVVFLPLGFAASIFSMSEAPPSEVLASMVICATVALLLTFVALAKAKGLNASSKKLRAGISAATLPIKRYTLAKMTKSVVLSSPEREKQPKRGPHEIEGELSWHLGFQVAYMLLELPARRVSLAFRIMKGTKQKVSVEESANVEEDSDQSTSHKDDNMNLWRKSVHVGVGILTLPACIIMFLIQLLLLNLADLTRWLWKQFEDFLNSHQSVEEHDFDEDMSRLTYPMKKLSVSSVLKEQAKQEAQRKDESSKLKSESNPAAVQAEG